MITDAMQKNVLYENKKSQQRFLTTGCSSPAYAIIVFAAYTAAVTHNAYEWAQQHPEIAPCL